jgi:predicted O-methyltransferase YrrM
LFWTEKLAEMIKIPKDLKSALDEAWEAARKVPGFLLEDEARFIGMAAICSAQIRRGQIIEIGSFKGKSTVMLAKVAQHYGLDSVVAIDPHNFNSAELRGHRTSPVSSSYDEFLSHLETAGVANIVEVHRAYSSDIAATWKRPISFLWIDGDHSYRGAKSDFDGFAPHLLPEGIVAFHDALHEFSGPIRVFVEDLLRSDNFGAAGFVRSIAWSQFRPGEGNSFHSLKASLASVAQRLIPYVEEERPVGRLKKIAYKLNRARVPRSLPDPFRWAAMLTSKEVSISTNGK